MHNDPAQIIEERSMSVRQWVAVGLTVLLNALDGFDVLSSAFAGPGIKQEWNLGPDGLGAILAMELIGMGVGSLLLGGAADRFGRRPTILACLALMVVGMLLAAAAASPTMLSVWRVVTGLGIGGMLAAINAVAFEFSSQRQRSFSMAMMVIGYPLGAFLGGIIASVLLQHYGWLVVFLLFFHTMGSDGIVECQADLNRTSEPNSMGNFTDIHPGLGRWRALCLGDQVEIQWHLHTAS